MLGAEATDGTLLLHLRAKDGHGFVRFAAVNAVGGSRVTRFLGMGAPTFRAQQGALANGRHVTEVSTAT